VLPLRCAGIAVGIRIWFFMNRQGIICRSEKPIPTESGSLQKIFFPPCGDM
jgi:hypothetical protein